MEGDYPNLGNEEYHQPHHCPPKEPLIVDDLIKNKARGWLEALISNNHCPCDMQEYVIIL